MGGQSKNLLTWQLLKLEMIKKKIILVFYYLEVLDRVAAVAAQQAPLP